MLKNCPHCGSDLTDVGMSVRRVEIAFYDASVDPDDGHLIVETCEREPESGDIDEFYCRTCANQLPNDVVNTELDEEWV